MKRFEAISLNNVLSEVKITGDGISRETRSSVMKTKIALSKLAAEFETARTAIAKEVEGLSSDSREQQFRELLSSQLEEDIDIKIDLISEDALNSLLDKSDLKTSSVELLYTHITDKKWN